MRKFTGDILITLIHPETGQPLRVETAKKGVLDLKKPISRFVYLATINELNSRMEVKETTENEKEICIRLGPLTGQDAPSLDLDTFEPDEGV